MISPRQVHKNFSEHRLGEWQRSPSSDGLSNFTLTFIPKYKMQL